MATVYTGHEPIKTAPDAPKLAICIPTRGTVSVEFMISMLQLLNPLNVKLTYSIVKGKLPAAARNDIVAACIERGIGWAFFLDDDILFPDITLYRLWVHAQKHPEAALITGVYTTKVEPVEPEIYTDSGSGAFWDWPLGALVPIHSGGAGCMIVNLAYAAKLTPPYFNDVITEQDDVKLGEHRRQQWGHDRLFMSRLRDEAGGVIYADTGLLVSHYDAKSQHHFILQPDSPCFQVKPIGEAYVPSVDTDGIVQWSRIKGPYASDHVEAFRGFLASLSEHADPEAPVERLVLLPSEVPA